jgi:ABC-type bacteriocin/lantibiotic exporter with double-glycine peptidase domain
MKSLFNFLPVTLSLMVAGIFLIFFSPGCATTGRNLREPVVLIAGVPFIPNRTDDCGPASLAMVLQYLGDSVSLETVTKAIHSPSARGTLNLDMVWFAEQRGFAAESMHGTQAILLETLDKGRPVILLVDNGLLNIQSDHYLVAVGYGQDHLIVNSGRQKHQWISFEKLDRAWERNNRWMLLVQKSS